MDFSGFMDIPVIDCHVHHRLTGLNTDLLRQNAESLVETIEQSKLQQMYAFGKNEHNSLYLKARYPGKFYSGGYVPWTGETWEFGEVDWYKYIQSLIMLGYDGVGEVGSKPVTRDKHVPLDSEYYRGLWDVCESHSFPVLCHIGDVEDFWHEEKTPDWAKNRGWGYYKDDYPHPDEFYDEIFNVLERHSELKIALCHFLFITPNLEQAYRIMEEYGNVNLDLSPGIELLYNISKRRDDWRVFFTKYSNRLIMGTDIGMSSTLEEHITRVWLLRTFLETSEEFFTPETSDQYLTRYKKPFIGLDLPKNTLEKIYSQNFQRLWGKEPKEVNLEKTMETCKGDPVLHKLFKEL